LLINQSFNFQGRETNMPPLPIKQGKRNFPGRRWLSISFRSLHLVGVVMLGAALLTNGEHDSAGGLVLVSGLAIYGLDLWCKPRYFGELASFVILVKLLLVGSMLVFPAAAVPLFWGLIVGSSLVSHAPSHLRHIRIFD
jgi:hypothetical protein